MDLTGRTAVVTGGRRGIGLAYCERLAADGANVVAVDLDDPTQALTGAPGAGATLGLVCDVSDPEQVARVRQQVLDRWGRCDILVNAAGTFPVTSLDTVSLDVWRRVQAVNVESILLFAQAFVGGMREARWGRIVNTGSANTLLGGRDLAYLTSKGGVHALTRALANELGDTGITVNAIAPSVVATEGVTGRARGGGPSADQVFERVSSLQTIPRPSVPADLANAMSFLVSDDASFITGQILHVDGGLTRSGA